MRILVTGGTGFIGRNFVTAAKLSGHTIATLVRTPSNVKNLQISDFEIQGDLASPPYAQIAKFQPNAIVHCAWIATPGIYIDSPVNIDLVRQSVLFLHQMIKLGVNHITITGTCMEYAKSNMPLRETSNTSSDQNPYVTSKIMLYKLFSQIAEEYSIPHSWARVFYPYGCGEHPDRLISSAIRAFSARQNFFIKVPFAIRDYIHVRDVSAALLDIVESKRVGVFNIGTGYGVRLIDILENIANQMNINPAYICIHKILMF